MVYDGTKPLPRFPGWWAALTQFPPGWSPRGQTLFWAYASIAVFLVAMVFSGVVCTLIERVMKVVAVVTVIGLMWACVQPGVLRVVPEFLVGLVGYIGRAGNAGRPWDGGDATKLLSTITFAGLGGFWILFYAYWLRDKGAGMVAHVGRITGRVTGQPEAILSTGSLPEDAPGEPARCWRSRFLRMLCWRSVISGC